MEKSGYDDELVKEIELDHQIVCFELRNKDPKTKYKNWLRTNK